MNRNDIEQFRIIEISREELIDEDISYVIKVFRRHLSQERRDESSKDRVKVNYPRGIDKNEAIARRYKS